MNIDTIIQNKKELDAALRAALSTMEHKDAIKRLREQIVDNQNNCPHISDQYAWEPIQGKCPYCGKDMEATE